ncbi:MAG: glucose 1-dehydrogenase [Thermaerobacter sp.]|nr:glucose 1-dehydrogenase [Thermaerobacter sp.]
MQPGATALVTGGASGIGRAIVKRLAHEALAVVVADVDGDGAERLAEQVRRGGGQALAVPMDVTDEAAVMGAIDMVHSRLGPIHALVNNAGIGVAGTVLDTSPADFQAVMAVNVVGTYLVTRHVLPDMLACHAGTIVNVGSVAGLVGIRDRAAYSASKGAVLAMTRALHADFHDRGIRVNAVVPGTVDTPWVDRITAGAPDPGATKRGMAARQPIGRMGTADEIADAVWFLMGPGASFVYGSWLVVDGGLTAL